MSTTRADTLDVLIVGGGVAGLVAAVYLARYHRRVVVIDEGHSRLAKIPRSRNVLGFPDGIEGPDLWERLRLHAAAFAAPLELGRVESLARDEQGSFVATAGSRSYRAPFVLLATGARDVEPDLPGLAESLRTGQVRYCPVCDGYETKGQRVAVLGRDLHGLRESVFVAGFENEVTWLSMGSHEGLAPQELARLDDCRVKLAGGRPRHIHCEPGSGVGVEFESGERLQFDVMYPALGLRHHSELATSLGARAEANGQLVVDTHCETTVPRLYAAGDVASGLNQINVAAGHASIAATAIHNRLG